MSTSASPAVNATPTAPTVFAVDDDESDRRLFLRAMTDAGMPHRCRLFACGDDLLDALIDVLRGAAAPSACFVDVKMAGMSGLDVLRWIRAQPGLNGIPVIMLSSSDDPQFLSEALQFGAQCYAAKFPGAGQLREILSAAERHTAAATCCSAFQLPCNLLVASRVSA
jgi:two-component system response regulator